MNTLTDCGACGTTCSRPNATATCTSGSCAIGACDPLHGKCDMLDANGCEPLPTWYHDADGDGYTNRADTQRACSDPDNALGAWVGSTTGDDCADNNGPDPACGGAHGSQCHPGLAGYDDLNGADNDCDSKLDEDAEPPALSTAVAVWYRADYGVERQDWMPAGDAEAVHRWRDKGPRGNDAILAGTGLEPLFAPPPAAASQRWISRASDTSRSREQPTSAPRSQSRMPAPRSVTGQACSATGT